MWINDHKREEHLHIAHSNPRPSQHTAPDQLKRNKRSTDENSDEDAPAGYRKSQNLPSIRNRNDSERRRKPIRADSKPRVYQSGYKKKHKK